MKRIFLVLFFIELISSGVSAQNAVDKNGLKTGPWTVLYPDSTIRYTATFKKGKPVGLMSRYNTDGSLAMTMNFIPGSDRCYVKTYSPNGEIEAEGLYVNQQKDSVWNYLGPDGNIRMKEVYVNGSLEGLSESFYPSGNKSREIFFENNVRNGEWIQFFESGDTMMYAIYQDDQLHGPFHAYYPEGKDQIAGTYYFDLKDGDWKYFSEEGELVTLIRYDKGEVLNPEVLEESYEKFIKQTEENLEDFPDPALDNEPAEQPMN